MSNFSKVDPNSDKKEEFERKLIESEYSKTNEDLEYKMPLANLLTYCDYIARMGDGRYEFKVDPTLEILRRHIIRHDKMRNRGEADMYCEIIQRLMAKNSQLGRIVNKAVRVRAVEFLIENCKIISDHTFANTLFAFGMM